MEAADDLTRLVAVAHSLGLSEEDLDDHVYDVFDHKAAADWNEGVGEDSPEGCFDLHDDYSKTASEINNGGLESQLRCLLDFHGTEATEKLLRESV